MFTKNEYKQYFTAIQNADKKMVKHLSEIISKISDPEIIKRLDAIKKQEQYHLTLSDELLTLVE